MRKRGFLIGTAALAVVVLGVSSCQKSAPAREVPATPTTVASYGQTIPTSEETVVSAVTPLPGTLAPVTPGVVLTQTLETPVPLPTPVPQATQPPTAGSGYFLYTVDPGDTLQAIATHYGTTVAAIVSLNNLANPSLIKVGQTLKIPSSGSVPVEPTKQASGSTPGCRVRHTVVTGDRVWQLARDYDVSPYDILSANGLTLANATIYPGQVLCIP